MTTPTSLEAPGGELVHFQLASDLHLEWLNSHWPGETLITPAPGADALLLAGDIANLSQVTALFKDWPVPVFLVPGNHEYFAHDLARQRELIANGAYNAGAVTVLDNTEVLFKGVRILGSTLWTNYRLVASLTLPEALAVAQAALSGADHSRIEFDGKKFIPELTLGQHREAIEWLRVRLAEGFDGPTLVMSHHAPSMRSVAAKWRNEESTICFASELPELEQADFWVHGHLHDSADYRAGACQVRANPRGYGKGIAFAERAQDMEFENPAFDPHCLVTVPVGSAWRAYRRMRPSTTVPPWLMAPVDAERLDKEWQVTDGARNFMAEDEGAARWLMRTLNAVARRGLKDESSDE